MLVMTYMNWSCKLLCYMYNPVQDHQGDRQGLQHAHLACFPSGPLRDCICNRVAHVTRVIYIQVTKSCIRGFQPLSNLRTFTLVGFFLQISAEEQKKMDEKVMVDGVKRVVSKLLARRKLKRSYEYEVQWEGQPSSSDYTAWLSRDRSVLCIPVNQAAGPSRSFYCA